MELEETSALSVDQGNGKAPVLVIEADQRADKGFGTDLKPASVHGNSQRQRPPKPSWLIREDHYAATMPIVFVFDVPLDCLQILGQTSATCIPDQPAQAQFVGFGGALGWIDVQVKTNNGGIGRFISCQFLQYLFCDHRSSLLNPYPMTLERSSGSARHFTQLQRYGHDLAITHDGEIHCPGR